MIIGMSIPTFITFHTVISLIGIAAGIVAVFAMLGGRLQSFWMVVFLVTTTATSVTGFMFPIGKIGPPHIVGAISLAILAVTIPALYLYHLRGKWRSVFVIGAVLSLYLNVFVGVVQAFQKLAPLQALAPTQKEPPFLIAQLAVLGLFGFIGWRIFKQFNPLEPSPRIEVMSRT